MPKRSSEDKENSKKRKIRKYQRKLQKLKSTSTTPLSDNWQEILIGSSPPEDEEAIEIIDSVENQDPGLSDDLDPQIIEILGEDPSNKEDWGPPLQKDIASRWSGIVTTGLKSDEKKELSKRYITPINCPLFIPPNLNPEAKGAVPETTLKRDKFIQTKQTQICSILTCLGQTADLVIKKKMDTEILKLVNDAGRMICDIQHIESKSRKHFVSITLNKTAQEAIKDSKPDRLLFGEGFGEKLKSCKAASRSSFDLKPKASKKLPPNQAPLNYRGPPRASYNNKGVRRQTAPPQLKQPQNAYRQQAPATFRPYRQSR